MRISSHPTTTHTPKHTIKCLHLVTATGWGQTADTSSLSSINDKANRQASPIGLASRIHTHIHYTARWLAQQSHCVLIYKHREPKAAVTHMLREREKKKRKFCRGEAPQWKISHLFSDSVSTLVSHTLHFPSSQTQKTLTLSVRAAASLCWEEIF